MTSNTQAAAQVREGERRIEAAKARINAEQTKPAPAVSDHKAVEAEIEQSDAERNRVVREQYFAAKKAREANGGDDPAPVDVHGANKRKGTVAKVDAGVVTKAENTTPTPSLDPRCVMAIDGFDEHADILGQAFRAFETAHKAVTDIFAARDAAASNPEWTPATQTIKTADYALKAQDRATKAWDSASANLAKTIAFCEAELGKPLESQNQTVTTVALAGEIRAHVKHMDQTERQRFMREAFSRKDVRTLQAVLSGPSFLSGMDMDAHDHHTRRFQEMQNPQLVSRLTAMRKAQELLDSRGPLIWSEVTRAVGSSWDKVNKMKAASTAAHAALIFSDLA